MIPPSRTSSLVGGLAVALSAVACERSAPTGPEPADHQPDVRFVGGAAPATGDAPAIAHPPFETATVTAVPGAVKVLLLHADVTSFADPLKTSLVGTGLFAPEDIDLLTMFGAPPALETLLRYDCAIVWTNLVPNDPAAQGDRLKQYVLAGGRVVLATYALSPPSLPWELQGGIMEDGFNPLDLTEASSLPFPRSLNFATALTGHPILVGVTDFAYGGNAFYMAPTVDPGALLVASDIVGVPLIAVSASGLVTAINVYPGGIFEKSPGVFRAFGNACLLVAEGLEVLIDIKPGSDPNSINVRSKGVIPVALLTTGDFDASAVDVATVAFGPGGASEVHGKGHLKDVDGDGDVDMVLHFRTAAAGLSCGDTEATLTGRTVSDQEFTGTDAVNVVGCGRKK